jgi:hypothetical protein
MLRKVLWLGLSAGMVFAAKRAAAKAWNVATGEPPPGKKA